MVSAWWRMRRCPPHDGTVRRPGTTSTCVRPPLPALLDGCPPHPPPRRAPAQWVRRSGGECECGIVAPMPPPRPNPTPAHPSAHPPSFDDPEDIVPIDVVAIARVVERRRSAARRAIDRDGPMDGGGGGDGRGRFRDPALSTNNTNGGGGSTRG